MSALFWAQMKDLTRRVEALEAAEKARSTPAEPAPLTNQQFRALVDAMPVADPAKRGPGRPKKSP